MVLLLDEFGRNVLVKKKYVGERQNKKYKYLYTLLNGTTQITVDLECLYNEQKRTSMKRIAFKTTF